MLYFTHLYLYIYVIFYPSIIHIFMGYFTKLFYTYLSYILPIYIYIYLCYILPISLYIYLCYILTVYIYIYLWHILPIYFYIYLCYIFLG